VTSEQTAHIELKNIHKKYSETIVFQHLNLTINKGEFIAIVGKSGCGKSTLLRLIAGLERPDSGQIVQEGKYLTGINAGSRIMFQDGRLLPWKRVIQNVELGLKGDHHQEAVETLRKVGLEERIQDWPATLSGGQKQRVALARALIHKPDLLLLDEPLGALDALTRIEMQSLIEQVWLEQKFTALLVTHDVEEAVALADRVILLENGQIAMDVNVSLSRPRERNEHAYHSIVAAILDRILGDDHSRIRKDTKIAMI